MNNNLALRRACIQTVKDLCEEQRIIACFAAVDLVLAMHAQDDLLEWAADWEVLDRVKGIYDRQDQPA